MPNEPKTPEEKLLKIIESPQTAKAPLGPRDQMVVFFRSGVGRWLKGVQFDSKIFQRINLKTVNKVLAGVVVAATLVYLFFYVRIESFLRQRLKQVTTTTENANTAGAKEMSAPSVKIEEVLARVRQRNIFTFSGSSSPRGQKSASPDVYKMIERMKLVGILWSEKPQAMIEDSQSAKTYFVSAGDAIGTLTVKKVLRDKVVLTDGVQEWDLR